MLYLGYPWRRSHHKTWHARRSMLHHQCTDQNPERVPTAGRTPESRRKPFAGARPPSRCTWSNSNETTAMGHPTFKTKSLSASDVNKMEPIPREHQMRHSQYEGRKWRKKKGLLQPHPEIATSEKSYNNVNRKGGETQIFHSQHQSINRRCKIETSRSPH